MLTFLIWGIEKGNWELAFPQNVFNHLGNTSGDQCRSCDAESRSSGVDIIG
jgi:hypothetical protein